MAKLSDFASILGNFYQTRLGYDNSYSGRHQTTSQHYAWRQ